MQAEEGRTNTESMEDAEEEVIGTEEKAGECVPGRVSEVVRRYKSVPVVQLCIGFGLRCRKSDGKEKLDYRLGSARCRCRGVH